VTAEKHPLTVTGINRFLAYSSLCTELECSLLPKMSKIYIPTYLELRTLSEWTP